MPAACPFNAESPPVGGLSAIRRSGCFRGKGTFTEGLALWLPSLSDSISVAGLPAARGRQRPAEAIDEEAGDVDHRRQLGETGDRILGRTGFDYPIDREASGRERLDDRAQRSSPELLRDRDVRLGPGVADEFVVKIAAPLGFQRGSTRVVDRDHRPATRTKC